MHDIEYLFPEDSIYSEDIWRLVEKTVTER